MRCNILKKFRFIGKRRLLFLLILCGCLFIYSRLFNGISMQHKEVLNIKELIDRDFSVGYKTNELKKRKSLSLGDRIENCGMSFPCSSDSFPVHIFTGLANGELPKLCVGGYYVFGKNLNSPGRGLNLALVDSNNSAVLRVRNFDTYESDPTQLEMFLEKYLQPNDILIIFTHDEAASKLSDFSRSILQGLGSGSIQNLKFRSSWYMVTQKGIKGFTPYEKLSINLDSKKWGDVFDEKFCVPYKIVGQSIHPDVIAQGNKERREFCEKTSGYGEFCGSSADISLLPSDTDNEFLLDHPVFSVPISLLLGISLYSLPITLETIIRQPGINPKMVTVFYMKALSEAEKIAALFKVKSVAMENVSYLYGDQVEFVFNYTVESHPDASHIIFLEEDLILSPDFMLYMAKMMPFLDRDPTLYSISAWNNNGYKGTSSNSEIVYRVNGFPGLGFMISKTTYVRQMRGRMKECCKNRPWIGWTLPTVDKVEIVVPDISRIIHRPYEGLGPHTNMLEELFNRERVTSVSSDRSIANPSEIILSNYELRIENLLHTAVLLDMSTAQLEVCLKQGQISHSYFTAIKSKQREAYVLYYVQNGRNDLELLKKLCKCFGLFYSDGENPRGLHKGLLRFTIEGHDVMLIGSASPYYSFKPRYHEPLTS